MLPLNNVRERFRAKVYHPVSLLLSVFSKVFKKLVSNKYLDLLEKCGLFSDFQYGFWSTAGLLTVYLIKLLELLISLGLLDLLH